MRLLWEDVADFCPWDSKEACIHPHGAHSILVSFRATNFDLFSMNIHALKFKPEISLFSISELYKAIVGV